jgi:hypothetical protein
MLKVSSSGEAEVSKIKSETREKILKKFTKKVSQLRLTVARFVRTLGTTRPYGDTSVRVGTPITVRPPVLTTCDSAPWGGREIGEIIPRA